MTGQGWLDREWSSQALAEDQQGWDWFSLRFDSGEALMVYQLRETSGDHWVSGTWLDAGGGAQTLGRNDVKVTSLRQGEVKTAEGMREVPLDWRIELPGMERAWTVRPMYDQQWMEGRVPYWEGVVIATGEGVSSQGQGYMELTGY